MSWEPAGGAEEEDEPAVESGRRGSPATAVAVAHAVASSVCALGLGTSVQEQDVLDRLLADVHGREEKVDRLREV